MSDRLILGKRSASEFGLWVSKPGKSAMSSNLDDFLISMTDEPGFIAQAGYLTNFTDTGRTNFGTPIYGAEVTHGLGYWPVFVTHTVGDFVLPSTGSTATGVFVDNTKIGFYYVKSTGITYNFKVYYALFRKALA